MRPRGGQHGGPELNGRAPSETCALPDSRLAEERRLLRPLPNMRPPLRRGELCRVDKLLAVCAPASRLAA
jgi:hypothetical protein